MLKLRAAWSCLPGAEPAAVEREYRDRHVPAVRALPALRRHNLLRFLRDPRGGPPLWWRGEELYFDDLAALDAAAASPLWREAWEDFFGLRVARPRVDVFAIEEEFRPPEAPPPSGRGSVTALSGIWQVPAGRLPAEVDPVYLEVHVPGVRALPGLQLHTVMKAVEWPAGQHARAWRSAEIRFDSLADFDATFDTPAYEAIRQDGFNASVAGPDVDIYAVEEDWRAR